MGQRKNISGVDLAAGVGSIRRVYLATDAPGVTSTTVTNVSGLAVALEANAVYLYRAFIIYSAGTVGDLSWSHSIPTGATFYYGDSTNIMLSGTAADTWSGQGTGTKLSFGLDGYIKTSTTAGNIQGRYAQNAADASNATTIYNGSWMRVERMA